MKDARPLDELTYDLTANHMLRDDTLDALRIDTIIQRCHAPRARQGRKPSAQASPLIRHDLANEHVGALRAAAKAALPHELGAFARVVAFERRPKYLVQLARCPAIAAFRPATNDDFEPSSQRAPSVLA
jgi:hypothetical protein